MVAIVATSSASPSLQATLSQTRLNQARQAADRAEADAQDLRSRADEAEREAKEGRNRVNQLSNATNANSPQAAQDSTYIQRLRAATSSEVPAPVQSFVERLYTATSSKFTAAGNPLKTEASSSTVVNAQGQSTGRILNVKA